MHKNRSLKAHSAHVTSLSIVLALSVLCVGCSSTSTPSNKELPKVVDREPALAERDNLIDAETAYQNKLYSISRDNWRKLQSTNPNSKFNVIAALNTADSHFYTENYEEARTAYNEFIRTNRGHEAIPYAMYQIAESHRLEHTGINKDQSPLHVAIKRYQAVIKKFPRTVFAVQAKEAINNCKNFLTKHEEEVILFYVKQDLYKAAASRYADLSKRFPKSDIVKNLPKKIENIFPEKIKSFQRAHKSSQRS
jgi:outer membrane assembly lipoprotein YfiO